jgi:23S rRNA pseudouridine1911/1915/1917 synthase
MQDDIEHFSEEPSETLYERKTFTIDKGQEPLRIDKWLQMHVEGATRNKVQRVLKRVL